MPQEFYCKKVSDSRASNKSIVILTRYQPNITIEDSHISLELTNGEYFWYTDDLGKDNLGLPQSVPTRLELVIRAVTDEILSGDSDRFAYHYRLDIDNDTDNVRVWAFCLVIVPKYPSHTRTKKGREI